MEVKRMNTTNTVSTTITIPDNTLINMQHYNLVHILNDIDRIFFKIQPIKYKRKSKME